MIVAKDQMIHLEALQRHDSFIMKIDQMTSLGYAPDSYDINPSHFVYCVYQNKYLLYMFHMQYLQLFSPKRLF